MNLQLDQLLSVPSNREGQLFEEITDLFIDAQHAAMMIQQQLASTETLCALVEHVRKYGITEENRDLFAMSFESIGLDYSEENVIVTAYNSVKRLIERIIKFLKDTVQAFFRKIRQWYNSIFKKKLQQASTQPTPTKEELDKFNEDMLKNLDEKVFSKYERQSNDVTPADIESSNINEFKELAVKAPIVSQDGKYAYVDDLILTIKAGSGYIKQVANAIKANRPITTSMVRPQGKTGTPAEAGWCDTVKLLKLIDTIDKVSAEYDTILAEISKLEKKVEKEEITMDEALMTQLRLFMKYAIEDQRFLRDVITLSKKAMDIRESILKGEVD